jgi:Zn-dependent protease
LLLAEPTPTPYDLHFRLLGIDVRVSPWFWAANALLGWSFATGISRESGGEVSTGVVLLIWTLAVFISILIHEMGHALTYRHFGVHAHIVLYQFGGLAIPDRSSGSVGSERSDNPQRQILVSLAGPGAQIIVAIVAIAILFAAGFKIVNPLPFIHQLDFLQQGKPLPSIALLALVYAFNFCSIWWALMNLLPVYPLDGGRISRELFTLSNPREGIRYSLILSIVASAGVAIWAWQHQDVYLAIMFALLGYSSFMTLQAYFGGGRGFGGGRW